MRGPFEVPAVFRLHRDYPSLSPPMAELISLGTLSAAPKQRRGMGHSKYAGHWETSPTPGPHQPRPDLRASGGATGPHGARTGARDFGETCGFVLS